MDNNTITFLGQQVPLALVLVYFQNWLKKQEWFPWLTYESKRLNHLAAILLSGAATLGIGISHTGSPSTGGTIIITLPSMTALAVAAYHWATQYVLSKTAYTALQSQLNPATQQTPLPVVVMPGSRTLSPPETPAAN